MRLEPILDNIFIEKIPEGKKTNAGVLLLSDNTRHSHPKAKVLSAGDGTKKQKMNIKEGDVIMYIRDSDVTFELKGQEHSILKYQSVIAVV